MLSGTPVKMWGVNAGAKGGVHGWILSISHAPYPVGTEASPGHTSTFQDLQPAWNVILYE